ncbi:MAG: PKD domain-containing protein [Chitinophagaceae bacterium]
MKTFTKILCFLSLFLSVALVSNAQVADFTADKTAGCDPLVVTFTNKSSGATSYSWDFGDFTSSTLKDPSKVFSGTGSYTVKLTAKNSTGGTSVKTMVITVYPNPTVSYTASPLSACPCSEITFTNTSVANAPGAYTSVWSFGDGGIDTKNSSAHTYCTPGKYNVALKVTNSYGCVSSRIDTNKITITEKPVAGFTASKTNLCTFPDSVTFSITVTSGKAPYSYSWDFGTAGTSSSSSPKIGYGAVGSYDVRLIVTDANGCKDTVLKKAYIRVDSMHSDFKVPSSVCAGTGLVRFDNISKPTPLSTSWTWSDGPTGSGLVMQRDFWKGGTFTVTMIDNYGPGCLDTMVKTYTAYPKPVPVFSYWPIYPCPAPVDVHFTSRSRGADSLFWIFGDGTTSKATNPVHTYTWDSVFTVWLIAKSDKGCLDTFRVRDTTFPYPGGYPTNFYNEKNSPVIVRVFDAVPGAKGFTNNPCIPDTVYFSAGITTNTHLPSAPDTTYPIPSCTVIKGYSKPYWYCSDLWKMTDPYPDDYFDPPYPGIAPPFIYPYTVRTYRWDFGDGSPISTAAAPVHIYLTEGRFRVICTMTTDSCTFTDTIYTEAGFKPVANFVIDPDTICKGDRITGTRLTGGALRYIWDWGDGHTDEDTSTGVSHRYTVSGDRYVTLHAIRYGCEDTLSKLLVINPPGARFGIKYFCDTLRKVQVLDSSYRANRWEWSFGDGYTATGKNPIHTYADTGVYTIRLIAKNDSFSCVDTAYQTIHLYYPRLDYTANNVCVNDTSFITWTKPDWVTEFVWSTTAAPVQFDTSRRKEYAIFRDTGYYSFRLITKNDHGCFDTFSKSNLVKAAKPMMKIVASPLIACFPSSVSVSDSSSNVQGVKNVRRTWYWGDATSTTDTAIKATKLYTAPGTYPIKVVTTDAWGCKDSATTNVDLRKPSASFVYNIDTYSCIGQTIKFRSTSGGTGLSYKWYFGDGGTATGDAPTHVYNSLGSYDVTLVVTDASGCKDSITKTGFVKLTKPVAAFTMADSVALCPPLFVACTNTSVNAIRYAWDFDGGGTSTLDNPTAPYIAPGVYTITLVAYDAHGCPDTARHYARVAGYDGAITYSPLSGCAPLEVRFKSDAFGGAEFVWDFADGYTKATTGVYTMDHTYDKPGAYVPRLALGDGKGCATTSLGLDTIKVDGVDAIIKMTPACINAEITFSDASTSYFSDYKSSEWILEDGTHLFTRSFKKTYTSTGTHTLRLISTNTNGCIDTTDIEFQVRDLPTITAADTVICLGDQVALTASGGVSYYWFPDATLSCSDCNTPTTSSKVAKNYIVRGTDQYGCTNIDTLQLGIKTKTTIVVGENEDVCAQTPIKLIASGAQQYIWSPEKFLNSYTIAEPIATADTSIVYRVIGIEGSCIPDTAFVNLTVHPLPKADAGADQKVLAGTEVQLNGNSQFGKTYLWSPEQTLTCAACQSPVAHPGSTTIYTLKVTSEFGCVDSDDVQIIVFCDQSQLFIPNTFTPNNDGKNDYFYPQGQGVGKIKSFIVFNRWGQKVFERHDMDANMQQQGWDGSVNGTPAGPDTYVYTVEATCENGETVFLKGDVTIIK